LIKDLTIIIYTYQRQKKVLVALDYWNNLGVKVICVDGSPDAINPEFLNKFSSNIKYYNLKISILERLKFAVQKIETKFAALIPDDEIFYLSGINESIKYLESDQNLVACGGQTISFFMNGGKMYFDTLYDSYNNYLNTSSKASERVKYDINGFDMQSVYSIIKSEVLREVINFVSASNFNYLGVFETQFELGLRILGRSKRISTMFWARNLDSAPSRNNDPILNLNNLLINWWPIGAKNDKQNYLNEFRSFLSRNLIQDEELMSEIENLYNVFCHNAKNQMEHFQGKNGNKIKTNIIKNMPFSFLNYYNKMVGKTYYGDHNELLKKMNRKSISYDKQEVIETIPTLKLFLKN
jgi:glycosyltransferase domain-containing protein